MIKAAVSDQHIYAPLLPEDIAFCELDDCGEIATWRCYPPDMLAASIALCDRCKQEQMREEIATDDRLSDLYEIAERMHTARLLLAGCIIDLLICFLLGLLLLPLFIMVLPFSLLAFVFRTLCSVLTPHSLEE